MLRRNCFWPAVAARRSSPVSATSVHGGGSLVRLPPFRPAVEARGRGGAQPGSHLHRRADLGAVIIDFNNSRVLRSSWPAMEARERKTKPGRLTMLGGGTEGIWGQRPLQQLPSNGEEAPVLFSAARAALLRSA